MNETNIWAGVVLIIAVLCIGAFFYPYTSEKNKQVPPVKSDLMSEFKYNFMTGCVSDATTFKTCSCAYDSLLAKFGEEGLIKVSMEYSSSGVLPDGTISAISSCLE